MCCDSVLQASRLVGHTAKAEGDRRASRSDIARYLYMFWLIGNLASTQARIVIFGQAHLADRYGTHSSNRMT